MARDSMQPWMDRLSHLELEGTGDSPRAAFGWREWDGNDSRVSARLYLRPVNPDIHVTNIPVSPQVLEDPEVKDDFDFAVASY